VGARWTVSSYILPSGMGSRVPCGNYCSQPASDPAWVRFSRLHSHRALDRIDHRRKLKEHTVPRGLHEPTAVFRHEGVGNLAVFAEGAGGADLVEAHEP
jgi:hypothetical protein